MIRDMPRRRSFAAPLALLLGLVLAGCGEAAPSAGPTDAPSDAAASSSPGAGPSLGLRPSFAPPSAEHPLPVIVDTDLAADDVYALLSALNDPALDVRAVTIAATGEVHCVPGLRNTRRLLAALGREDVPVACGRENPGPNGRWFPPEWRAGADAFYGVELPAVDGETARGESAAELLVRLTAQSDTPITLLTLGPLSNVADAEELDPTAFARRLAGIHAMAGTIDAPGNIDYSGTAPSDGVEWNVGADPDAMAEVLAMDVPITLVGLDATNHVPVPPDIVDRLGADHAAAAADIVYEMYAKTPFLSDGASSYWDPLAALTLTDPSLATWEDIAVTMQPTGPGAGRLSRDAGGRMVRAAMAADGDAFMTRFLSRLRTGEPRANPFTVAGELEVHWDGSACTIAGDPPTTPGTTRFTLVNTSDGDVNLVGAAPTPPKSWDDVMAWVRAADFSDPSLQPPAWVQPLELGFTASAGGRAAGVAPLPAGPIGVACATGTFPDLTFHDGGSFTVGD